MITCTYASESHGNEYAAFTCNITNVTVSFTNGSGNKVRNPSKQLPAMLTSVVDSITKMVSVPEVHERLIVAYFERQHEIAVNSGMYA